MDNGFVIKIDGIGYRDGNENFKSVDKALSFLREHGEVQDRGNGWYYITDPHGSSVMVLAEVVPVLEIRGAWELFDNASIPVSI